MDATQFIFIATAALIVASAVMVVTTRNLVHAALWLIAALFGVAVIFILLEAGFLAVVQVVVYIGAIAIMFIFAVMLTRRDLLDHGPRVNKGWPAALVLSLLTLGGIILLLGGFGPKFGQSPVALSADLEPGSGDAHAGFGIGAGQPAETEIRPCEHTARSWSPKLGVGLSPNTELRC